MDAGSQEDVLRAAAGARLRLLYVSPERLRDPRFRTFLPQLPLVQLVVDEGHCIATWGHDFCPDFLDIARLLPTGPGGQPLSVHALTATATAQVQMLSPRTVIRRAGNRILVDGRACAPLAATRRIVVASAFPPAADTVVVDESHGRLADRRAADRPEVVALTGTGGDTMEVIGTPGSDRYVAHDALGASIDLGGDPDPDFVSTDVGHIVLFGRGGDDRLLASSGPGDRVSVPVELHGGPGRDVLRGGRSGNDLLNGGQP
jgi:hypothetical protein